MNYKTDKIHLLLSVGDLAMIMGDNMFVSSLYIRIFYKKSFSLHIFAVKINVYRILAGPKLCHKF